PDGHTASLFPGSAALAEEQRWVVANWAPEKETWRMTLTFPVLNAARAVLFVVTGEDKQGPLAEIRDGASDLPAARVAGDEVEWIVDEAAAGEASAA
ncbi:MAG TPA: 6-phosphogluconolactonase, partial [Vitreimonas sp.]|nr:6-phosphogluconolactonase [Vitreimonas sp.]